jgi:outer membrane receptor protein involved in Fe transport
LNNSVTGSLQYKLDVGAYGNLAWNAAYTVVIDHTQQTFPGDPVLNLLTNPEFSTEFKTKVNAGVTWSIRNWNATLYGSRDGRTPNLAAILGGYSAPGAGTLAPWTIWNMSIGYSPIDPVQISVRVNNLLNAMPPRDPTQNSFSNLPFNVGNYNPYGRQVLLEARYRFGHSLPK